ncbi:MAG: class I SAM-dependent methyltransferase [Pseudomonadota bacterium]
MSAASELAAVELRIDWQQDGIAHRNRQYFERINFWRDILPGTLSLRLPDSTGEWVGEEFAGGELVPPYSERNLHRVPLSALRLARSSGPQIRIHRGRHYPRYIAAGTADIHAGNVQPLRIAALADTAVVLDLNHPLAEYSLAVSARIDRRLGSASEHGGRCNDPLMDMLAAGVGLETLYPPGATDWFAGAPFARMDPRDDAQFYARPRLVHHLDRTATGIITALYQRLLAPGMRVLDLMSSWVSHLPAEIGDLRVSGLGMNAEELAQNAQLRERVVHDLNAAPVLPWPAHTFDAAVCTASIEYLTRPVEVLRELGRVLKPGAPCIFTFTERWFPTKAIALWSDLHPFERMALVLEFLRAADAFGNLGTESVRGYPRPADDKYADQLRLSDPVYAVWGRRGKDA